MLFVSCMSAFITHPHCFCNTEYLQTLLIVHNKHVRIKGFGKEGRIPEKNATLGIRSKECVQVGRSRPEMGTKKMRKKPQKVQRHGGKETRREVCCGVETRMSKEARQGNEWDLHCQEWSEYKNIRKALLEQTSGPTHHDKKRQIDHWSYL